MLEGSVLQHLVRDAREGRVKQNKGNHKAKGTTKEQQAKNERMYNFLIAHPSEKFWLLTSTDEDNGRDSNSDSDSDDESSSFNPKFVDGYRLYPMSFERMRNRFKAKKKQKNTAHHKSTNNLDYTLNKVRVPKKERAEMEESYRDSQKREEDMRRQVQEKVEMMQ